MHDHDRYRDHDHDHDHDHGDRDHDRDHSDHVDDRVGLFDDDSRSESSSAHPLALPGLGPALQGGNGRSKPARRAKTWRERYGDHPAVEVFFRSTGFNPPRAWWAEIEQQVGRHPEDLRFWGRVVHAYLGTYRNPRNVKGLLDFFRRREIPGEPTRVVRQQALQAAAEADDPAPLLEEVNALRRMHNLPPMTVERYVEIYGRLPPDVEKFESNF